MSIVYFTIYILLKIKEKNMKKINNIRVEAKPFEFDFTNKDTALIIIDMQRDFVLQEDLEKHWEMI